MHFAEYKTLCGLVPRDKSLMSPKSIVLCDDTIIMPEFPFTCCATITVRSCHIGRSYSFAKWMPPQTSRKNSIRFTVDPLKTSDQAVN